LELFSDLSVADLPSEIINVVALRWEPPDFVRNEKMLCYIQDKIETLFSDFNLQLKPIIFCDPEIPWDLIKRYR